MLKYANALLVSLFCVLKSKRFKVVCLSLFFFFFFFNNRH